MQICMVTQDSEVPCNAKAICTCLEDKHTSSLSFMDFRAIKENHPGNSTESNVELAANYKTSLQVVEHFPLADF